MHTAACAACGKRYRVPDPDRVYPCRACGGEVRGERPAAPESPAAPPGPACPSCGAPAPEGGRFCEACGQPLDRKPRRRGKRAAGPDLVDERLALAEIRRVVGWLKAIRLLFLANVLLILVVAYGTWKAWRFGFLEPEAFRLRLVLGGLLALLYGLGAWKVMVQPFLWTLLLAALVTVNLAVLLLGESGGVLVVALNLYLAASTWSAVAGIARMVRLLRKHPNLRISHTLVVEDGRLRELKAPRHEGPYGEVASRARARSRASRWGLLAGLGGAAAVVLVVLLVRGGIRQAGAPPPPPALTDTAQNFCDAWNEAAPPAAAAGRLARFFADGEESVMTGRLARRFRSFGWSDRLPRLRGPELKPETLNTRCAAFFTFPDLAVPAPLETWWEHDGRRWCLRNISYPRGLKEAGGR